MKDVRGFADGTEHHFLRCPKADFSSLKKYWDSEKMMKKKENGGY